MPTSTTVNTAVMHVTDVKRSSAFYTEVLGCRLSLHRADSAILLTSDGFQIYLIRVADRPVAVSRSGGLQFLEWSAESEADLDRFQQALEERGLFSDTRTVGGVRFVQGVDPDRSRVVMGWPPPSARPRSQIDARFYA